MVGSTCYILFTVNVWPSLLFPLVLPLKCPRETKLSSNDEYRENSAQSLFYWKNTKACFSMWKICFQDSKKDIFPQWNVSHYIVKLTLFFEWLLYIYIYIYIYIYHHHHIALVARISLTLSRHSSLSFIALGRSSGQHPVSSHSCWMYVRAGRPAFARPCVGIHKSTSLMSSSLLLQQCPACLVLLTWIVFVIGGRWPYSWCLVGCCCQDLFRIARSILVCIYIYIYI